MQKILAKVCLSVVLLTLAGSLAWYAAFTNRIAAGDWEFVKKHHSARLFPQVSYWWGNYFYYVKSDPAEALGNYRESLYEQPLLIDPWLELVKTRIRLGDKNEARRVFSILAPFLFQTSYWKWKELLLAFDLDEEAHFERTFNFILARSPYRSNQACDLGLRFWGDWKDLMAHVGAENRQALLRPLIERKAIDELLALWREMKMEKGQVEILDKNLLFDACDFALENGRVKQAKEIWNAWLDGKAPGVHDGEFELQPANGAFGWRICQHPQVQIAQTSSEYHGGQRSLHLRFLGTGNPSYSHVSQIVPVEPGRKYILTFARKSRNITSDQGVLLKLSGYQCEMAPIESRPLIGTSPWDVEKVEFQVPEACEAFVVQVCRSESLKLDNVISGDFWLDSVELHEGS